MKQILVIIFTIFSTIISAQENTDFLMEGNNLLNQNKPKDAELIFKKGIEKNPNDLILKNQLALSQINQKENLKAQETLNEILESDSLNVASLWYSGINNYTQKPANVEEAIKYFEKVYPLLNKNSGQFFGLNYFIGNSYRTLLYTKGLSYDEVSRMLETLKIYTDLQPEADDYKSTKEFITKIEQNRAPKNVKKWIITTQENAEKVLQENMK